MASKPEQTMTIEQRAAMQRVLEEVAGERYLQHTWFGEQNLPDGTSSDRWGATLRSARAACEERFANNDGSFLLLLSEEVAEAFAEENPARLRAELVQVAAVAVQWVEAIDRREAAARG